MEQQCCLVDSDEGIYEKSGDAATLMVSRSMSPSEERSELRAAVQGVCHS